MRNWTEENFDQYLLGTMDSSTRRQFEADLESNPAMYEEYRAYSQIVQLLQQGYSRKQMKKHLRTVHAEMIQETGSRHGYGKRFNLYNTWNLGIAASVAALVTLSLFFFSGNLGLKNHDDYLELRNEMQDINSEQEYIKNELKRGSAKPVYYTGTSFAVSSDGILATNYHVIRGLDSVWVSNYADTLVRYTAHIVYRNAEQDIALLKIVDPAFKGFGKLPYSRPQSGAEMGENVFTLGYSKQEVVFGEGSISSVSGYFSDTSSYQVSIPVNPGNSGGPLFDNHGNLLGMISGKNTHKDGVGFAIKSDFIYQAMDEMAAMEDGETFDLHMKNRLSGKKRTDQIKTLKPLVFKVQTSR